MGSGRGKARRARSVAPSLALSAYPDPVVFMQGRGGEQCLHARQGEALILISERHAEPEMIRDRIVEVLEVCHPRLVEPLRFFGAPYDTLNGTEPHRLTEGSVPASAVWKEGLVVVWGTRHPETGYHCFSQQIVEHELAHLCADETGVPAGMVGAWEEAQKADAAHHLALPRLPVFGHPVQLGSMGAHLFYGEEAYSVTSADAAGEEWATAVEHYLVDERQGFLWRQGDYLVDERPGSPWEQGEEELRFSEYYPNRAKLIKEFLDGHAVGGF